MKIIIAGGRDFTPSAEDWLLLEDMDKVHSFSEVVSGGAKGADTFGESYAEQFHLKVKRFPANWDKYKKAAGPIRNEQMAKYADAVILFSGGKGTNSMRSLALKHRVKILYDEDRR